MRHLFLLMMIVAVSACNPPAEITHTGWADKYATVTLTTDTEKLSDSEKQMIPHLIKAAELMDELFWQQAYGDKKALLESIDDETLRKFAEINYGPWDRLDENKPFIEGVGKKPAGANYYPADITKEDVENADLPDAKSLYTLVRKNDEGKLITVPYNEAFAPQLAKAAEYLKKAADLAQDQGLKKYLNLRAEAFLSNNYYESDMAWMDMQDNGIDVVIGPIETYEDQLFGAKAAFECYVLIKDREWSKKLTHYAALLPQLQAGIPVADAYKKEEPGTNSQLNAYDVVYYAGDCNSGSKTIAINLPNDEKVQLAKGSRRLQLKNAMRAKFDKILLPIAGELLATNQQKHITFDAFFSNTMFHEVAHGLGIKNTINGKGTVREALQEHASAIEEGKADILGLYMITELAKIGEFPEEKLMDNYVTFMASIFRSIRFGGSSAHGKANMIRFNYFNEKGAFTYDEKSKKYAIDFEKMGEAMNSLSELILTLQGDGNYNGVKQLVEEKAVIGKQLQADLDRLAEKGIPVDVVFEQGVDVLGL